MDLRMTERLEAYEQQQRLKLARYYTRVKADA